MGTERLPQKAAGRTRDNGHHGTEDFNRQLQLLPSQAPGGPCRTLHLRAPGGRTEHAARVREGAETTRRTAPSPPRLGCHFSKPQPWKRRHETALTNHVRTPQRCGRHAIARARTQTRLCVITRAHTQTRLCDHTHAHANTAARPPRGTRTPGTAVRSIPCTETRFGTRGSGHTRHRDPWHSSLTLPQPPKVSVSKREPKTGTISAHEADASGSSLGRPKGPTSWGLQQGREVGGRQQVVGAP